MAAPSDTQNCEPIGRPEFTTKLMDQIGAPNRTRDCLRDALDDMQVDEIGAPRW